MAKKRVSGEKSAGKPSSLVDTRALTVKDILDEQIAYKLA
jgi:hypothetical protein